MSHPGDNIVLYLLLVIILLYLFRKWIYLRAVVDWSTKKNTNVKKGAHIARGEVPDLLQEAGFNVISGKEKVELTFFVNEEEYESRIYIDYMAEKENSVYIVIVAKDRKPIRMSGPSLRDAFLSHYLLFHVQGILYVHRDKRSIQVIEFDVPDFSPEVKDWKASLSSFSLGLGFGVIAMWWIMR